MSGVVLRFYWSGAAFAWLPRIYRVDISSGRTNSTTTGWGLTWLTASLSIGAARIDRLKWRGAR